VRKGSVTGGVKNDIDNRRPHGMRQRGKRFGSRVTAEEIDHQEGELKRWKLREVRWLSPIRFMRLQVRGDEETLRSGRKWTFGLKSKRRDNQNLESKASIFPRVKVNKNKSSTGLYGSPAAGNQFLTLRENGIAIGRISWEKFDRAWAADSYFIQGQTVGAKEQEIWRVDESREGERKEIRPSGL